MAVELQPQVEEYPVPPAKKSNSFKPDGKEFNYVPKATKESIITALEWVDSTTTLSKIKKENSYNHHDSLGNWCVTNGKEVYKDFNRPCHASLSGIGMDCAAFYVGSGNHDNWKTFRDWMTDDSFISEFVLAKGENGFVVSTDIPSNLLHCIAMISRTARMYPERNFLWFNELLEKGVPGEIAFLTCFTIIKTDRDARFSPNSNHTAFPCPGIAGFKRFLTGEFQSGQHCLARMGVSHSCSGFLSEYYSNGLVSDMLKDKKFREALTEYRKEKTSGEVYRPPNPFTKTFQHLGPNDMTITEVHEVVIPYCLNNGVFK